jgi:hypothetical protein
MGTARRVARRLAEACGESVQAKRTRLGLGWSQCVLGHGARSVARGKTRRWSVGSGRRYKLGARHVFDEWSSIGARTREDGRNKTNSWRDREGIKDT